MANQNRQENGDTVNFLWKRTSELKLLTTIKASKSHKTLWSVHLKRTPNNQPFKRERANYYSNIENFERNIQIMCWSTTYLQILQTFLTL